MPASGEPPPIAQTYSKNSEQLQRMVTETARHWAISSKIWFRHPLMRILVASLIWVHDMYLFGEDPTNDSHVEASIPGVGNVLNFFALSQSQDIGFGVFRVILISISLIAGLFLGRQVVHGWFLRDKLKLGMFGFGTFQGLIVRVLEDTCADDKNLVGFYSLNKTTEDTVVVVYKNESGANITFVPSHGHMGEENVWTLYPPERGHGDVEKQDGDAFEPVKEEGEDEVTPYGEWRNKGSPQRRLDVVIVPDTSGSIFVIFLTTAFCLYVGSLLYNATASADHQITGAAGMTNVVFGKVTQCISVCADFQAVFMITDAVLQDTRHWPNWCATHKGFWINGLNGWYRVIVIWGAFTVCASLSIVGIATSGSEQGVSWDNRRFGGLTEVSRSLFVASIFFCDLFTVVQDWDFPSFEDPLDVMFAGTFSTEMSCPCVVPACLWRVFSCLPPIDTSRFTISGKWLTFGPLMMVVCLDLSCAQTQIFYDPILYGHYVHPETHRIWAIRDHDYLDQAYHMGVIIPGNESMISFEARQNATTGDFLSDSAGTDIELNSMYIESNFKFLGLLIGLCTLTAFISLILIGNRRKNYDDVNGSLLKGSQGSNRVYRRNKEGRISGYKPKLTKKTESGPVGHPVKVHPAPVGPTVTNSTDNCVETMTTSQVLESAVDKPGTKITAKKNQSIPQEYPPLPGTPTEEPVAEPLGPAEIPPSPDQPGTFGTLTPAEQILHGVGFAESREDNGTPEAIHATHGNPLPSTLPSTNAASELPTSPAAPTADSEREKNVSADAVRDLALRSIAAVAQPGVPVAKPLGHAEIPVGPSQQSDLPSTLSQEIRQDNGTPASEASPTADSAQEPCASSDAAAQPGAKAAEPLGSAESPVGLAQSAAQPGTLAPEVGHDGGGPDAADGAPAQSAFPSADAASEAVAPPEGVQSAGVALDAASVHSG